MVLVFNALSGAGLMPVSDSMFYTSSLSIFSATLLIFYKLLAALDCDEKRTLLVFQRRTA